MGSLTDGAPPSPPSPGREWYLPEDFYFLDSPGFPTALAARVTARYIARWTDRYEVYPLSGVPMRKGRLPRSRAAREKLIDELFDWLESLPDGLGATVCNLYQQDVILLNQHDGIPGFVGASPAEFEQLQDAWQANKLPADLYYPAQAERVVVEAVQQLGGVFRFPQRYSPLRWARRNLSEGRQIPEYSDEDGQETFISACRTFQQALLVRMLQLRELSTKEAENELNRLGRLSYEVGQAMLRNKGDEYKQLQDLDE